MKFSLIIPTHNRRALLQRTLQALAEQRDAPDFEVCVTNNASTDDTAEYLAAASFPYTLHVINESQPNRALARNRGLAEASGTHLLFIDDDVLVPAHFLAAHGEAHATGIPQAVTGPILMVQAPHETPRPQWFNHSRAYFCTCNASVPLAPVRAVGGFDVGFSGYGWEDTELGVRLRQAGIGHAFAWDAYVYHLKPQGWESFSSAITRMQEKGRMARRFVDKHPNLRVRLATGDYAVNRLRGALLGAPWTMPLARELAERPGVPALVQGFARAHYLDGIYRQALRPAPENSPSRAL